MVNIDRPKISVIVPAFNAAKTILDCIESVNSSEYDNFELIAVDDASTDNTGALLKNARCIYIRLDKNSGPGTARNKGAERATGDIFAFLDADCKAPADWLKNIAERFRSLDIAALTGGYSGVSSKGVLTLFQFFDTMYRQRKTPEYIRSCITANFAIIGKVFREFGGFPDLRINEDMEFGMTVSRKYMIYWDRQNGVIHSFNNSKGKYFKEQMLWAYSAVSSYLADPRAARGAQTWDSREIILNLAAVFFIYCSLAACFFTSYAFISLALLTAVYAAFNMPFLFFISAKQGIFMAVGLSPLIFVRDTAWGIGTARACILKAFKYFNPTKQNKGGMYER